MVFTLLLICWFCWGTLVSHTCSLVVPSSCVCRLGLGRASRLCPAPSPQRQPSLGCLVGQRGLCWR